MTQIQIALHDTMGDRRLELRLPADVPLARLAPALARKLGLPEGEYTLTVEGAAVPLAVEATLAGAGVGAGAALRLERVAPKAPSVKAEPLGPLEAPPIELAPALPSPAEAVPPPPAPPPPAEPTPPSLEPPLPAEPAPPLPPTLPLASQPSLVQPVKGFHWKIVLSCIAGSVLGSTLGGFSYCAWLDYYDYYGLAAWALWAIWGGMWAAAVGPLLKPRRAWALLAVGIVGLGTVGRVLGLFEWEVLYWANWPIAGAVWGLAIAIAFELPAKRVLVLAFAGALGLGIPCILRIIGVFNYVDDMCYTDVLELGLLLGPFDLLLTLYGLVSGSLLGGALAFFYAREEE